ncbi:hypothetical protein BaRGS_00018782 [Batillaria attramentaria]|uniref:Secreted protein n=1 Tax=Batillaria attramentaria TaxID=370345 RepID=A0ABD0KRK8_9CAEN
MLCCSRSVFSLITLGLLAWQQRTASSRTDGKTNKPISPLIQCWLLSVLVALSDHEKSPPDIVVEGHICLSWSRLNFRTSGKRVS